MQINLKIFHSFNDKPFMKNFYEQQILYENTNLIKKGLCMFLLTTTMKYRHIILKKKPKECTSDVGFQKT
jgi:hypothetical protein